VASSKANVKLFKAVAIVSVSTKSKPLAESALLPPSFQSAQHSRTGKEQKMKRINLKHYYPYYTSDCFVEVPDDIAAQMHTYKNQEAAYRLRTYRYKAYFSLDRDDGIENDILLLTPSAEELTERHFRQERLLRAIRQLPEMQARRIYSLFFLGISKHRIAQIEGVNESNVRKSIDRGLVRLKKILEEF
jgi:RNA polymerase sigma-70 factor (ECF subfamily)